MELILSTKVRDNQVNNINDDGLEFVSNTNISSKLECNTQCIVTVTRIIGRKEYVIHTDVMACIWDSGVSDSTTNRRI